MRFDLPAQGRLECGMDRFQKVIWIRTPLLCTALLPPAATEYVQILWAKMEAAVSDCQLVCSGAPLDKHCGSCVCVYVCVVILCACICSCACIYVYDNCWVYIGVCCVSVCVYNVALLALRCPPSVFYKWVNNNKKVV